MSAVAIFMMFFSPFGYSELFICMSRCSVQGNCKDLFPFVYIVFIHITWVDFLWYDWPSSNALQIINQNSTLYTVFPLFLLVLFLFLCLLLISKNKILLSRYHKYYSWKIVGLIFDVELKSKYEIFLESYYNCNSWEILGFMFNWNLVYICMSHSNNIAMIWERIGFVDVYWLRDIASLISMLQGPLAAPTLQHLTKEDLSKFYFGEFRILDINGAHCFLTRTGYASSQFHSSSESQCC